MKCCLVVAVVVLLSSRKSLFSPKHAIVPWSGPSVFSSISEVSVLLSVILLFRSSLLVSASNFASRGSERNPAMLIFFTICWILKKDRSTSASSVERAGALIVKETPKSNPGRTWIKEVFYFEMSNLEKKSWPEIAAVALPASWNPLSTVSDLVAKFHILLQLDLLCNLLHFAYRVNFTLVAGNFHLHNAFCCTMSPRYTINHWIFCVVPMWPQIFSS